MAYARVFESLKLGMYLWKQSGLHFFRNLQLLCSTTFGLELLGEFAALRFNSPPYLVETSQSERISVRIFKPRENSTPRRFLRWRMKANSALTPFVELGNYVFREKVNLAVAPNEFALLGIWPCRDEREIGATIKRCDFDPPVAGFKAMIHHHPETKLVLEKP